MDSPMKKLTFIVEVEVPAEAVPSSLDMITECIGEAAHQLVLGGSEVDQSGYGCELKEMT